MHGYRGADCRANLGYSHTGKAVFFAAALGVVRSPAGHPARFAADDVEVAGGVEVAGEAAATAAVKGGGNRGRADRARDRVRSRAAGRGPRQQFMREHTDDVISMAVDETRTLVATGEVGRVPKIKVRRVWSLRRCTGSLEHCPRPSLPLHELAAAGAGHPPRLSSLYPPRLPSLHPPRLSSLHAQRRVTASSEHVT